MCVLLRRQCSVIKTLSIVIFSVQTVQQEEEKKVQELKVSAQKV
jgi:hypothetical protein